MCKQSPADYFRRKFSSPRKSVGGPLLESTAAGDADLKDDDILRILYGSKEGLYKMIEHHGKDVEELKKLADQAIEESRGPLEAVAAKDDKYLQDNGEKTSLLEVIVQVDGSRPSFMVKKDRVDMNSSPVGDWEGLLTGSKDQLKTALQCVGRINLGARHVGTGFLVHKDLIVTNLHVLQSITAPNDGGQWKIHRTAYIDFGFEYEGLSSVNPRMLKEVVYCGPRAIPAGQTKVDHTVLDLAILKLDQVPEDKVPLKILDWNLSNQWTAPGTEVYTIGYPGNPGLDGTATYTSKLLNTLFMDKYGCKRLAPGKVVWNADDLEDWTVSHDASTLGGNSGSLIVAVTQEGAAAALHYGGTLRSPRENWGHILSDVWAYIAQTSPEAYEKLDKMISKSQ